MPLYEFCCPLEHTTESVRPLLTPSIVCRECGRTAARLAVNRVAVQMGADQELWKSPVRDNGRLRPPVSERKISLRQYREATEQLAYEHERQEESAQRKLPEPSLAGIAMARAKALMRDGITDSLDMPK